MATQQVLQVHATGLLFADATDFPNAGAGPPTTAANDIRIGTGTKVQIDLTAVAAAAARASTKTSDLGSAWSQQWMLGACIESTGAPTAGGTIDFYWAPSPNSTAATGNPGNVSGTDAVYAVAGLPQLMYLGAMTVLNQVVNIDTAIRKFYMPNRYGTLVIVNNTDQAFAGAGVMDETHITVTPVIPDIQAAA